MSRRILHVLLVLAAYTFREGARVAFEVGGGGGVALQEAFEAQANDQE